MLATKKVEFNTVDFVESRFGPMFTCDKVDDIGDRVDRDKLSNSSCCRFVPKTSKKVYHIGNRVDRIGNSRLCRQCVRALVRFKLMTYTYMRVYIS